MIYWGNFVMQRSHVDHNQKEKKNLRLPLVPSTALGRQQSQRLSILILSKSSQQNPLPRAISVGLGSASPIPPRSIILCKGVI